MAGKRVADTGTTITEAGKYYGILENGRMVEVGDCDQVPDAVIVRRVSDFPRGEAPEGAAIIVCKGCLQNCAIMPNNPHRDRPMFCFQCHGMEPLPIPE